MRSSGHSLRSRLVLLVLVATLPAFTFAALLLVRAYLTGAGLIEETLLGSARRVAAIVDSQIERAETIGTILSELPSRDIADLDLLNSAADRVLQASGLDATLELVDPEGDIVGGAPHVDSEPPSKGFDPRILERVFKAGQSTVADVLRDGGNGEPLLVVHAPLRREGTVRYDVAVLLRARSIARNAALSALPPRWFAIVATSKLRVIADTVADDADPRGLLPASIAALIAGREQGYGTATIRDGEAVQIGFMRSPRSGWPIIVGMPRWLVYGPLLRSIGVLAFGGAALFGLCAALAWRIARNLVRPIGALASQAARLGAGADLDPEAGRGLAETEALAQALQDAADQLQARQAEREAALARAERSEASLLLAQEVGEMGSWEIDLVTGERIWSQQLFALYGRDPAAGPPNDTERLALTHPDDRDRFAAAQARARQQPMSYQQLFRIVRPNGDVRWLRSAGRSIFADGRPERLIGTTIDVTDRQEAERQLRESASRLEEQVAQRTAALAQSEQLFRTYFEFGTDAMLVLRVEEDGRFVFETINRVAERMLKITSREIAGLSPTDVLAPETAEIVLGSWRDAVANGTITVRRTLDLPMGTVYVETVLVPVHDPASDRVVRLFSGSRDLSERQRIDEQLHHAQRLEALGQLTGGVAHDFNNLLTIVVGNLSLLRYRLKGDERGNRYLDSVEAAAERGAKLTAGLLAFARRQTLQVEQVDIGARIAESGTLLRRALREEIEFELDIEPDLPPAEVDSAKLEAAVLNLVINGRDAIEEAMTAREARVGRLKIGVQRTTLEAAELQENNEAQPGTFVAVSVTDNGIGMSQAVRARAFEPFFTTKEVGRGTGLGLSQVFGFVRQLGGHVSIDSTPGRGTTVTMYLRAAEPGAASPPAPPPPELPQALAGTILIVEDDPSIVEITAELLRDAGVRVLVAADGPQALRILRGPEKVDALFSDIVLPGGTTGVDLADEAQALQPGLSVLLTSGYGSPTLDRFGTDRNYDVLAKPYTRAALLERLSILLDQTSSSEDSK